MDFLANENFPLLSVKLLRKNGQRVVSVIEETPAAKDQDILKRAYEERFIVLTYDRDYGELIYKHRTYTPVGVVYFRYGPAYPEEPAKILLKIFEEGRVVLSGKFTVIERGRIRQRTLSEVK